MPEITDSAILNFVRRPATRSNLQFADSRDIEKMNVGIAAGNVINRGGEKVDATLKSGLINENGSLLFPVRGGIFTLVSDRAIEINGGKR